MKKVLWGFAVILFAHSGWAQTREISFYIQEGMLGGAWMKAPCSFNGQPGECKIDFGANMSSLRMPFDSSGLESQGKVSYIAVTGQTQKCDIFVVPEVRVGSSSRDEMSVVSCPGHAMGAAIEPANILGLDFFAGEKVLIDMQTSKMILGAEAPHPQDLKSFHVDRLGHIVIPITMGHRFQTNQPSLAMVDTGAAMTVVDREFVARHPQFFKLMNTFDQGRDTHGNPISSELYMVSGIQIDGHIFVAEYAMAIDFTSLRKQMGHPIDFIVGQNLMKNVNWYFDFEKSLWDLY